MAELKLCGKDAALVAVVRTAIRSALEHAQCRSLVARRIASEATRQRNRGRAIALAGHPFTGVCEATGKRLNRHDAVLDELEPAKGYLGKVRWVCPKCNNSGRRSCG